MNLIPSSTVPDAAGTAGMDGADAGNPQLQGEDNVEPAAQLQGEDDVAPATAQEALDGTSSSSIANPQHNPQLAPIHAQLAQIYGFINAQLAFNAAQLQLQQSQPPAVPLRDEQNMSRWDRDRPRDRHDDREDLLNDLVTGYHSNETGITSDICTCVRLLYNIRQEYNSLLLQQVI